MSSHFQGSGPRSNAYSVNKFTNWATFNPFHLEVHHVYRRFDKRIAAAPKTPRIIVLPPTPDFQRPCSEAQIEMKLRKVQPEYLQGLRAIFVLSGTKKQLATWRSRIALVGCYWNKCVFLHAYPWIGRMNLDQINRFYIDDVLLHEIGHHVDRFRDANRATKEGFANYFPVGHERMPASEFIPTANAVVSSPPDLVPFVDGER